MEAVGVDENRSWDGIMKSNGLETVRALAVEKLLAERVDPHTRDRPEHSALPENPMAVDLPD